MLFMSIDCHKYRYNHIYTTGSLTLERSAAQTFFLVTASSSVAGSETSYITSSLEGFLKFGMFLPKKLVMYRVDPSVSRNIFV